MKLMLDACTLLGMGTVMMKMMLVSYRFYILSFLLSLFIPLPILPIILIYICIYIHSFSSVRFPFSLY